ncbi:MAG: YvcK family protein [Bacteroidetes bacterium]|nr:YvcK family protein [Bacteroidota bacterium]
MNLIYAGAYLHFGHNFEEATLFIDRLFKLRGTVLPTSNEDRKLVAIREDGTILFSEAEIVELRANSRIKRIYLLDQYPDRDKLSKMSMAEVEAYFDMANRLVNATSRVTQSIAQADIIIYSPGTQHSSLYPSYMTAGITDAIAANKKALKVFITNIGEDYETPSYDANDFIEGGIRYMRMGSEYEIDVNDIISVALVNNRFSTNLENYVKCDEARLNQIGCPVIIDAFEDESSPGKHNGVLLSKFIIDLYERRMNLGSEKHKRHEHVVG